MQINQDRVPTTLEEAVDDLVLALTPGEREEILATTDRYGAHFGLGLYLRNNWSLWDPETPLVKHIKERFKIFGHGDDCSGIILHCFWKQVLGKPWAVEAEVDRFKEHWREHGVDPETGAER